MMNPAVSIIISTYNAAEHLDECFESLAMQTYSKFVVHILDDCSSDLTQRIIKKWCARDERFQFIGVNERNMGLTVSLNKLLQSTNTEFVARMDADDCAFPQRLERQLHYMRRHQEISILGSWAIEVNEDGMEGALRCVPQHHDEIRKMIMRVNPMIHPSVMFRRAPILAIGGYNERYRYTQDYALWFDCLSHGLKMANIPEPLIRYRVNQNHLGKRGMAYRKIDAAVRWHGLKAMGVSLPVRIYAASIPLLLGLMPYQLKKFAFRYRDRLDPRHGAAGSGTLAARKEVAASKNRL
jgi:glycosyltransferase EpsE